MLKWLSKAFGDSNDKLIKRYQPIVEEINRLEPQVERLSDEDLLARAAALRERIAGGARLDGLLPEVFALVREAAKRAIGQRHYDVQLIGGMVLHEGKIAEMRTGEGKTLVATLAASLNALTGRGVHVVTVNDYLAKRDAQWMGAIYHKLGLSVASIQHEAAYLYDPSYHNEDPRLLHLRPIARQEAYLADITYGTNNEFGFDYLRDNMVQDLSQIVQRELHYAIVDEVDNILIDEARTPLIISGQAEESAEHYIRFAQIIPRLRAEEDYTVDERVRAISLTEAGIEKVEKWLGIESIYDPQHYELTRYLDNALKAQVLYHRDDQYIVKNGEVIIVDEFTGRLMPGRRYSEGLHQAIEAKEGVRVQPESITYATITFQNYFRMYEKLAGMTGTAATESEEFHKIYRLDVVTIPTNRPMIRDDYGDQVYKNEEAKFNAVVREIKEMHEQGRPVLVGTTSIEKSEYLAGLLQAEGIPHQVLNAKLHEQEAGIVAQAGRPNAVTIATNMAGRGTDILLGGNLEGMAREYLWERGLDPTEDPTPEQWEEALAAVRPEWERNRDLVVAAGGLHIIGTERHESRRIDNQLRGRSGRQGDPGSSRFYVSLEDDIMRRFGGDRIKGFMEWAGLEEDVPIEHGLVTKSIENAQTKVEGYNFDIRKHVVEYDDVMNRQREVIYDQRRKILSGADLKANILEWIEGELEDLIDAHLHDELGEHWDLEALYQEVQQILPLHPERFAPERIQTLSRTEARDELIAWAEELYAERESTFGPELMRAAERFVMLRVIDGLWVEHLTAMDHMRTGISLRAYGQSDPLVAYKKEAHEMYESLMATIRRDVVHSIYHVNFVAAAPPAEAPAATVPATVATGDGHGADGGSDGASHTGNGAAGAAPSGPTAVTAARNLRTNRDDQIGAGNGALTTAGGPRTATAAGIRKVGRNESCPCGSGKKYKKCHGASAGPAPG
ncbi:MAG TPA: preprotein translocase subunit SecA [Dehalococcoidia bacterium]|nr:preprotein translocase subunit SecA [Dehalococcoidia bacterium]